MTSQPGLIRPQKIAANQLPIMFRDKGRCLWRAPVCDRLLARRFCVENKTVAGIDRCLKDSPDGLVIPGGGGANSNSAGCSTFVRRLHYCRDPRSAKEFARERA